MEVLVHNEEKIPGEINYLIRRLSQKIRTLDMFSNVSLLKKTQNSLSKNTEGVFSKKLDFCACVCYLCEGKSEVSRCPQKQAVHRKQEKAEK